MLKNPPSHPPDPGAPRRALSQHRSHLESILNVAHLENKLSWQLGWAGEKNYASGAFIGCGLAEQPF